mmetsp:Transcript_34566/g.78088  ORF Transcript_34566/g.78088 Transcript_34566/m.78088 type:complete len:190 (-) Transcript_34566:325-894(-)
MMVGSAMVLNAPLLLFAPGGQQGQPQIARTAPEGPVYAPSPVHQPAAGGLVCVGAPAGRCSQGPCLCFCDCPCACQCVQRPSDLCLCVVVEAQHVLLAEVLPLIEGPWPGADEDDGLVPALSGAPVEADRPDTAQGLVLPESLAHKRTCEEQVGALPVEGVPPLKVQRVEEHSIAEEEQSAEAMHAMAD